MAGLADFLRDALQPRREQRRTPPTTGQMISRAHSRLGSWRAVSKAFGVSESTLRRWRHEGVKPSAGKVEAMRSWDAASRMRRAALPDSKVTLRFDFDGRSRHVSASNLRLRDGTMERVRQAWVAEGPQAGVAAFLAGIGDRWYRQHVAAWDARERAVDQLPEATAAEAEELIDADEADMIGAINLWGDTPEGEEYDPGDFGMDPAEVVGEEIQTEIADYEMSVSGIQ